MQHFFKKEQALQIYRLCQQGYADEVTVARLANLEEERGLQRYIDEARRRKDVFEFKQLMKAHKKQLKAICAKWVQECLQSGNPKAAALKMKPMVEALELVEAFREAWKEQTKSQ